MTEEQLKELQDIKDLYNAGSISYAQYKLGCMKVAQNDEIERTLFRLRGIAEDSAKIVQDVTRIERDANLYNEEKIPKVGLVNQFARKFKSTPPGIDSAIWKIALEFDRKTCEFAIERKTKKVFAFKQMHFDGNRFTADYRFFDETEEDMAREFEKSDPTGLQILDFSYILEMSNEEFERIVGSIHNADIARKYRQVMLKQD